jgi:hypothetical protein
MRIWWKISIQQHNNSGIPSETAAQVHVNASSVTRTLLGSSGMYYHAVWWESTEYFEKRTAF